MKKILLTLATALTLQSGVVLAEPEVILDENGIYDFCKVTTGYDKWAMKERQKGIKLADIIASEFVRLDQIYKESKADAKKMKDINMRNLANAYKYPIGKTKAQKQSIIDEYENQQMVMCIDAVTN